MGLIDRLQYAARALAFGETFEELPVDLFPPVATPTGDALQDPNDIRKTSNSSAHELYQSTSAMYNAVTGAGTSRDPSSFNQWATPRALGNRQRAGMGRNALIAQALGKLPTTAVREGWRIDVTEPDIDGDEKIEIADMTAAYEERLGIGTHTARSVFRGRQYGQSFVLLGIEDGRNFDQPVDRNNIRKIKWSAVFDSRDFQPHELHQAESDSFGQVKTFEITDINGVLEDGLRYGPNSVTFTSTELEEEQRRQSGRLIVHSDRVLYFPTADFLPLLDSLQDSLGAFFEATGGIRTAARESSTVVYKISGMLRKMWSANSHLATQHMGFVDRAKSAMNAWVIDKDHEEVSVVSRSLSGVANLADPFMVWLAAALAIPVTVLWGVSPGGFGKGEAERETWHEEVRAFQTGVLTPQLTKLHDYILAAQDGGGFGLRKIQRKIAYTDLSPPDEKESSDLRSAAIADLVKIFDSGLGTRDEIRPSVANLSDDYFQFTPTEAGERVSKDALVGAITGTILLAQSTVPEGTPLPIDTVERLLARLIPGNFDEEGAAFAFAPIKKLLNPDPEDTPMGTATPGSTPVQIPEDEEDAAAPALNESDEPSELDIAWSEAEPPADAATAKAIVEGGELGEVTTRQIKQLANNGELTAYRGRAFSKEPLFSLAEVRKALLTRQGHMAASAEESDAPATPSADAASVLQSAQDLAEPDLETIYAWLRDHYSGAVKLQRPRIKALLALRAQHAFLRPPITEFVYRGLRNVNHARSGKLIGLSNPVHDKSWTTDKEQAYKFAAGEYTTAEKRDDSLTGAVLTATPDREAMLLNAGEIAEIPEVAGFFVERWGETLRQAILDEREVLVYGSLDVIQVRTAQMGPRTVEHLSRDAAASTLFVSLRLPKELAQWVPYKAEDSSAPHVTLLYVPDVPATAVPVIVAALETVLADVAPFEVSYDGSVDYFPQSDLTIATRGDRIAYAHAQMSIDPQTLFDSLAVVVESMGLKPSRFGEFVPHTTLAYVDAGTEYSGPVPEGSWTVAEIEVQHDGGDVLQLPLQLAPGPDLP